MILLVGLGNPGEKYARNRHNIGFMAADAIVRRHSFSPLRARFQGLVSEGTLDGAKAIVLKPTTYMNESGRAVGEALRFYKLTEADVIVFHDELDLAPAKLRIKTGGGAAGHNGIRSIAAHIGPDFRRVRIGIGHPGEKDRVLNAVLGDFSKAEMTGWVEPLIEAIADAAPLLAEGKDATFANKVHLALNPEPPKKKTDETKNGDA
ncbi:MAG: aminoacyl-tRNA hydrolase [Parvibaculum sp.]|uniref:aminoacyl-tRNA hydrolase n=1 Tax=Parvibaculum sp. TaxID=2024848 RepID=UPI00271AE0A0|nr:aminoacyl-tRNA hydrolase [Parvibaculum sp.]MDO8839957.1 aminoacyl-tRNA hydrolase [Parvibaculum sp.]